MRLAWGRWGQSVYNENPPPPTLSPGFPLPCAPAPPGLSRLHTPSKSGGLWGIPFTNCHTDIPASCLFTWSQVFLAYPSLGGLPLSLCVQIGGISELPNEWQYPRVLPRGQMHQHGCYTVCSSEMDDVFSSLLEERSGSLSTFPKEKA